MRESAQFFFMRIRARECQGLADSNSLFLCHCLIILTSYYRMSPRGDKKPSFGGQKMGVRHSSGDIWGTKLGKNLQINNTLNKNLQISEQSLTLENKRFTGLFLQILCVSLQLNYFPTQKWEKMLLRVSWGVIWLPVISARMSRVWRRSSLKRSPLNSLWRPSMTR